jgi:ArsR family transcriptional regulator
VPQPRISQNLAKFRALDLVVDERNEKYIIYSLRKENGTLMNILRDIITDMESFPVLMEDRAGLSEKEKYLTQCGVLKK